MLVKFSIKLNKLVINTLEANFTNLVCEIDSVNNGHAVTASAVKL